MIGRKRKLRTKGRESVGEVINPRGRVCKRRVNVRKKGRESVGENNKP